MQLLSIDYEQMFVFVGCLCEIFIINSLNYCKSYKDTRSLKQVISILIVIVFLMPSISRLCIMVDFNIHRDYIARVLCINKDKPQSSCNGKCHLKKQLKKVSESSEEDKPKIFKEVSALNLLMPECNLVLKCNALVRTKQKLNFISPFKISFFAHRFFRPPQFIS